MKTANEMRLELARKQRMKKTQDKWIDFAGLLRARDCWKDKVEHGGARIGDRVEFADVKAGRGGCISFTKKCGTAFAFGKGSMIVIYRGEMKKVRLVSDL